MLRNYLAAALRNLVRNKLYAAINLIGLTVGLTAALIIALYVRDELSYDKWIPEHQTIYRASQILELPGRPQDVWDEAPAHIATWLKADFSEVVAATRLAPSKPEGVSLRRGDTETTEHRFFWADPNVFTVLPLRAVAGDLRTALERPDSIVITRAIARKYFGRDTPIGESIEIDRQYPMFVTAVLEDLPSNTHLGIDIVASGRATFSPLLQWDGSPAPLSGAVYTYFQTAKGASISALLQALPAFVDRNMSSGLLVARGRKASESFRLRILPIAAVHLAPTGGGYMKQPGNRGAIYAITIVGLLILVAAGINFVNLMTARAVRRATEVGVRKVCGAFRLDLIAQFIGESLIYVAFSALAAVELAGFVLPRLNGFLDRTIVFHPFHDPLAAATITGAAIMGAVLAGFYPALVLSAFHPATVIRNTVVHARNAGRVRQGLVVLQFAILIGLTLATATIQRQVRFAAGEALRFDHDQVLLINGACDTAFKGRLSSLPGVRSVVCSYDMISGNFDVVGVAARDGTRVLADVAAADFGFFEFYGIAPVAGRLFSPAYGQDAASRENASAPQQPVLINETAARKLGFASPTDAVGKPIPLVGMTYEIVGVVPDVYMASVRSSVQPTAYWLKEPGRPFAILNVKLAGQKIPETLKAIDELWRQLGEKPGPVTYRFFDQYVQSLYVDIVRQSELFSIFAAVALFIAGLGLFGLAAFTAERRTKEIGIRKAMGATRADILRLVLWEFTKPVLSANIIAWPVGYFVMRWWLEGFAYHIDLQPWMFLAASALALIIAVVTVIGHALRVARSQPVTALRYE